METCELDENIHDQEDSLASNSNFRQQNVIVNKK